MRSGELHISTCIVLNSAQFFLPLCRESGSLSRITGLSSVEDAGNQPYLQGGLKPLALSILFSVLSFFTVPPHPTLALQGEQVVRLER